MARPVLGLPPAAAYDQAKITRDGRGHGGRSKLVVLAMMRIRRAGRSALIPAAYLVCLT